MDNTPKKLTSIFFLNFLNNSPHQVHTSALGVSSSLFPTSKGVKRKLSTTGRPIKLHDGSLVLGLGCSTSSGVTVSSGKEIDEQSSINLRTTIQAGNRKYIHKNPNIDLELSLSTFPSESDTTTFSQVISNVDNQLVDEDSTSLGWKLQPSSNSIPVVLNLPPPAKIFPETSQPQKRNYRIKTCQYNGCSTGARGGSGLCIAHGGGRRCDTEGCKRGAEGKTALCKAHGGGRRCHTLGCTKSAEGRTNFCIAHGGGRRCNHVGCTHAARGRTEQCISHGGGKRCKIESCTKSAECKLGLCISHGGGPRCQYPSCTKGAQGSTKLCKAHGGGKRCTFEGCKKGADGSTLFCKGHGGGKRCSFEGGCSKSVHGPTLFCVKHGGGKRCAVPDCSKSSRGKTDLCVHHGGGKRCKYEGCGKSAQGSTDFCKAHGGGKRCCWSQLEVGGGSATGATPRCNKIAKGKSGLCAVHSAQVEVNGGGETLMLLDQNNCLGQMSLPEGRVHGGSLMAMLTANRVTK